MTSSAARATSRILKALFIIFNDGAYGSEIHKLRLDGVDDSGAVFGADLTSIAKGFGLRGATMTDQFRPLFEAYVAQDKAEVWNVHISDQVTNPSTRRRLGVVTGRCGRLHRHSLIGKTAAAIRSGPKDCCSGYSSGIGA